MFATLRWIPLVFVAACMSNSSGAGAVDGSIKGNPYPVADSFSATVTGDGGGLGAIVLSSAADACRPANAQIAHPSEKTVVVIVSAVDANGKGQVPTATGTYTVTDPNGSATPNTNVGFLYTSNLDATCSNNADDQTTSVSGTITIDSIDNGVYSGSFDVTLDSGDHITGSFDPSSCSSLPDILTGSDTTPPTCTP